MKRDNVEELGSRPKAREPFKFTKAQITYHLEQVRSAGDCCPFCLFDQPVGEEVTSGNGEASQAMSCSSCHKSWVCVYTLTGILPLE